MIGSKVFILPEATIGEEGIIGVGVVVTKDIPSYGVAVTGAKKWLDIGKNRLMRRRI